MNEDIEVEEWAPWALLLITLAGGLLRVLLIGTKGMWLDETFSVWLAHQSLPDLLQWTVKIDPHPPLYYLLLHYWIALFGDTANDVRLLSALFGTATIPIVYLIGQRLSGALVGVAAALLLAFSPFNIYFAQEARMYTLLMFNAAVAIYALARLLTDPRAATPIGSQLRAYVHTWRTPAPPAPPAPGPGDEFRYQVEPPRTGWRAWIARHRWPPIHTVATDLAWLVFVLFTAAAMLTHNTALLLPLATNTFVLGLYLVQRIRQAGAPFALQAPALRAPSLANWLIAQLAIFLLWSPWAVAFVRQAGRVYREFWLPPPTGETVALTLQAMLNASAPGEAGNLIMAGLLGVLLCLALLYYRKKLSIFFFLAALFAVPFLGELLVSIYRPIFYGRTLIWITLPLFLLLAAGIAQLRFRPLIVLVLGILALNSLFSTGDYYRFAQKEDWSTAAGYVANFAEPGDLVLFNSNFVAIPFDYYIKPYEEHYALQLEKQGVPLDLFDSGILEPKMTAADIPGLTALVRGRDRVWLVYSHDAYTDPLGLVPQTLASLKQLTRTREFYGGQVQLYETP
jgi:mannosyltransferase